MNETLQEFVDSRGVEMRVDRRNGVITSRAKEVSHRWKSSDRAETSADPQR